MVRRLQLLGRPRLHACPVSGFCFECGADQPGDHLRWCATAAPTPIDFTEPKARARGSDPATSHAAAASVTRLSETKRRILELVAAEPSTDYEIRDRWSAHDYPLISDSGLRTRRSELVDDGLLIDAGEVRTGPTGRAYTVWRTA